MIQWHQLFASNLEAILRPVNVEVLSDVKVMAKTPMMDVLLLRRSEPRWTPEQMARLPDGIRNCTASHVLLEFKYTESLSETVIHKAIGYDVFYKEFQKVDPQTAQSFIVSSKTPQAAFLTEFGYQQGAWSGVMESKLPVMRYLPLIILNELSSEPHNLAFKIFASRRKQRLEAIEALLRREDNVEFDYNVLSGLFQLWTNKEFDMNTTELSNEKVIEMGRKFGRRYLQMLPPEERMRGLSPDDVFKNYSPEQIKAYLKGLESKS